MENTSRTCFLLSFLSLQISLYECYVKRASRSNQQSMLQKPAQEMSEEKKSGIMRSWITFLFCSGTYFQGLWATCANYDEPNLVVRFADKFDTSVLLVVTVCLVWQTKLYSPWLRLVQKRRHLFYRQAMTTEQSITVTHVPEDMSYKFTCVVVYCWHVAQDLPAGSRDCWETCVYFGCPNQNGFA